MAITVRFDKNGFYHPAYGRLGRGKNEGKIYKLPDAFGEVETIRVPLMDHTAKPPRESGKFKEITRFKNIPSTAEIIKQDMIEELEYAAEEGDTDAAEELAEIKAAKQPKVATPEALEKVTGRGKVAKAQSAKERTTGTTKRRSRKAVAAE